MLTKENVEVPRFICTLKIARFLDEENLIPEYNLQYLRYHHELEIEADAHDAKSDVLVLGSLFKKMFKIMLQIYETEEKVIEKMIDVSKNPFLIKYMNFGKYTGRKVEEIVKVDRQYLEWYLNKRISENNTFDDDWIYTLKYYLSK